MAEVGFERVLQGLRRLAGGGPSTDAEADPAILARFLAGDETAFAALLHRHGTLVWNVCRRVLGDYHSADDAFQATFLVLLRRAQSLRAGNSLAGWLHAVALRTALRVRADTRRRWQREVSASELDMIHSPGETDWLMLRPVLDEELLRLPDNLRQPIVLCYLEGKTNDEAAAILGWTRGTVAGRLSRARDILRARLSRRGITLAPALLWTLISDRAQAATVPPAILAAAATLVTQVPEAVNQLARGVLATMYRRRIKTIALCTAASVLTVVLAGFVYTAVVPFEPTKTKVVDGGKPSDGLRLTLSAVRDTTTTMQANRRNAVAIELVLTITNVSDKPIKLDIYDMHWGLAVTGPDLDSVTTGQVLKEVDLGPPAPNHFPVLEPGKTWHESFFFPHRFKNSAAEGTIFNLLKTGEYRLKATYMHPEVLPDYAPAAKSWTGELHSNELMVTVK